MPENSLSRWEMYEQSLVRSLAEEDQGHLVVDHMAELGRVDWDFAQDFVPWYLVCCSTENATFMI